MKTYSTEIVIWSAIGHTPVTKRKGSYCDEILRTELQCTSPTHAKECVKVLINNTEHARSGHFSMPDYPNQNTRNNFVR